MSQAGTKVLEHPNLGRVRGKVSPDGRTIQYRGLKYASIPERWAKPQLCSGPLSGDEFDGTTHGPHCPQQPVGMEADFSFYGDVRLPSEPIGMSELDCLNAVVTVPNDGTPLENLPVMILVHGGGLFYGSGAWPQYDLQKFVARSMDIGMPVVTVAFNYRLGVLGFLASDELGSAGNFGYQDQACALDWIRSNVAGFGGSPENMTAVGESAGAISISAQIVSSKRPQFNRAVIMSGDVTCRRPVSITWHNEFYQRNMKILGLEEQSPSERVEMLKKIPVDDLIAKVPPWQYWRATAGTELFPEGIDLASLGTKSDPHGKRNWCDEVVFGNTGNDGTVWRGRYKNDPTLRSKITQAMSQSIPPEFHERLLRAWGIDPESTELVTEDTWLQLLGDLAFYFSVVQMGPGYVEGGPTKGSTYHYHRPNPFPGLNTGLASHEIDLAYLLQNFNHLLPESEALFAQRMADVWIKYINGQGWPVSGSEQTLLIGPEDEFKHMPVSEYDKEYCAGRGKLMSELGWEKIVKFRELLQGSWPKH